MVGGGVKAKTIVQTRAKSGERIDSACRLNTWQPLLLAMTYTPIDAWYFPPDPSETALLFLDGMLDADGKL